VLIGFGIGPFTQRGLDEALGLAIGLGCIGPGADVLEAEPVAGASKGAGFVARTIVGHDPLDPDAEAGVVGERGFEEGDGAAFALILLDFGKGDAGRIINADVDVLPADATAATLFAAAADDAMADLIEPAEFFNVDVDEFAGVLTLVAAHRLGRFQSLDAVEAQAAQNTAHSGGRDAEFGGDLLAGVALPAQLLDLLDNRRGRRPVQAMRPRTAILQPRNSFTAISVDPLANGPRAHACGFRDRLRRLSALDLLYDPLSTERC